MRLTRKKLVLVGTAAAAVVGAASVAFACHIMRGQLTLTGNIQSGTTVKGTNVGSGFCTNPTIEAQASASNGKVTVSVAPATCGVTSGQLANGNARVALQRDTTNPGWTRTGAGTAWTYMDLNGCWGPNAAETVTLATTFSIVSGSATAMFTIPTGTSASDVNEAGTICIRDSSGSVFAHAPLVLK